jgi:hypothetical protein
LGREIGALVLAQGDARAAAYKDKVRTLVANLRHADNGALRWRVLSGELSAEAVCGLSRIVRPTHTPLPRAGSARTNPRGVLDKHIHIHTHIHAHTLCLYQDLAPAQKRQEIEEHKKKNTMDAMEAKPIESVTDAVRHKPLRVCVCVYMRVCMCVWACVCVRVCLYVCVLVHVRAAHVDPLRDSSNVAGASSASVRTTRSRHARPTSL